MVLRTKNFNIFGVHWKIRLLGGRNLEKPRYRGRLHKKGGAWTVCWFKRGLGMKEGGVYGGGWCPNAHYDYFVPFGVIENRFTKIKFKSFNGNCDYSCWAGWWILYALPHKGLTFWKNYLWTSISFSYSYKITCILLRQVISLKTMMVLSVKFTILISWSPVCIHLILLSALMRLASTSAAVFYKKLDSWHHWRTHIGVKGSNKRPFILILDSILVHAT